MNVKLSSSVDPNLLSACASYLKAPLTVFSLLPLPPSATALLYLHRYLVIISLADCEALRTLSRIPSIPTSKQKLFSKPSRFTSTMKHTRPTSSSRAPYGSVILLSLCLMMPVAVRGQGYVQTVVSCATPSLATPTAHLMAHLFKSVAEREYTGRIPFTKLVGESIVRRVPGMSTIFPSSALCFSLRRTHSRVC